MNTVPAFERGERSQVVKRLSGGHIALKGRCFKKQVEKAFAHRGNKLVILAGVEDSWLLLTENINGEYQVRKEI